LKKKSKFSKLYYDWGGLPVFGAGALILVIVVWLIWSSRPGSTTSDEIFQLTSTYQNIPTNGTELGDNDSPLTIWLHEDFQCSHCKTFSANIVKPLIDSYVQDGRVKLVFVNTPILGKESFNAATGSLCAADQNLFWEYHDILLLRQGKPNSGVFSLSNLEDFADELVATGLPLDTNLFSTCINSEQEHSGLLIGAELALKNGFTGGTPYTLVGNYPVSGVVNFVDIQQIIENQLK
jgi:protein-disulfide isomerase|tara:strand:+ start:10522 stop:11229 length:708 start_codon:yes stop_codon:yes gene_type:complete